MKILVTGGAGFIGSHLVEHLLGTGFKVRVLDNFSSGRRDRLLHLADDVELIEGDVQSYERAHNAVRDCEIVFHQAALPSVPRSVQDPLTTNAVNVIGTLNVLLAARDSGVRRVIYASSSSVYGLHGDLPKREDQPVFPASPYAVGKLAGEGYCRSFSEVYGLETVMLRYFNIFGPRQDPLSQYSAVIPRFITALDAGQRPTIYGDGEQSRDFTYVDNVVAANLLALDADVSSRQTFNIACGERVTLNSLVRELQRLTGSDSEPIYEAARPGEVRHSHADIERAEQHLGYRPVTRLADGLARTLDAYREASAFAESGVARDVD
jgi:UDP-glucose 4-epimerase